MTKQEFGEFYAKNKIVVIGVPIIIFIVLFNTFVLKPSRLKKKNAMYGKKVSAVHVAKTTVSTKTKAPITPPPPIRAPFIPKLDKRIVTRFKAKSIYPYSVTSRDIFRPTTKKTVEHIVAQTEDEPEVIERPDITYHGFFTIGKNRVAILKMADKLIYSKLGSLLNHTSFRLQSVTPDKIIIEDTSDTQREFEISLADTSSDDEK